MPDNNRQHLIGSLGVSVVCIILLCVALFGSPPYAFYGAMKWAVAAGAVYGAWTLFQASKTLAPVSLILAVVAGIHFFAKMRREDWVVFNWAGVIAFALAVILLALQLKTTPPDGDAE